MVEPAQRVEEILRRTGQRRESVTGRTHSRLAREFSTIPGGRDRNRDYSSIEHPANDDAAPRPRNARVTPTGTPITTPGTEPAYNGETNPATTIGVEIEPKPQPNQPRQANDMRVEDAKRDNDKRKDESLGLEKLAGKVAAKLALQVPTEAVRIAHKIVEEWRKRHQGENLDQVTADDDRVTRIAHHKDHNHLFASARGHGSHPTKKPEQQATLDPKVAPKGPTFGHA